MCYEKTEHGDRIWGAVAGKVDMSNILGIRLMEYLRKKEEMDRHAGIYVLHGEANGGWMDRRKGLSPLSEG